MIDFKSLSFFDLLIVECASMGIACSLVFLVLDLLLAYKEAKDAVCGIPTFGKSKTI